MKALIIIALFWAVYKLIKSVSANREAERAEEERRTIILEQTRIKEDIRADRERAKEMTRRQIEEERQRIAWQKRQDAINRQAQLDRERLRREQERHAAQLAKHDAEIEKLKHTVEKAEFDIGFLLQRVAELDSQLDYLMIQQSGTIPGSKQFEKYQNQIVAKHNQIYAAESKLNKAQYAKAQAAAKLSE